MREGRAEDHRGAPDSDEERGHTLADSSRAVVRERRGRRRREGGRWETEGEEEEEMEVGRKGRQWAQHGFNNKNSGGCRLRGLFWRRPRSPQVSLKRQRESWGEEGGGRGRGRE